MCGILGVLGSVDPSRFAFALDRLEHRGPDGSGIWTHDEPPVVLGHRRLAILDPSEAGRQPMHYGDWTIIFNGEVYNFVEVREALRQKGHVFRSDSDTEVVLAAFAEWGEGCLSRFNGMWALAIWSKRENALFLARDRFGKKPLFYSFQGGRFIFGSEMKALAPLMDDVRPDPEFDWAAAGLFDYETTERCLVEGIRRFPAGSFAWVRARDLAAGRIQPVRYWNTLDTLTEVPRAYGDQVERFRELFVDAVRLRMRSDVPIGTALSGGLDSSAVACTMREIAGGEHEAEMADDWQHAFVATFPGSVLDEREYAEAVVDEIGAKAVYLPIDPSEGIDRLLSYMYYFEEIYPTSPIPMMEIYRTVARHGVKVTIDGHGADELLSGYDGFLRALNDSLGDLAYAKHILRCWGDDDPGWKDVLRRMLEVHHGGRGLARFVLRHAADPRRDDPARGTLGYLNSELYAAFHQGMLPTLLRNYDRYSMASGVEIRMPFMDHRLVSFCFSLPWQSKVPRSSTYTKALLRDAIGPWMPEKVRRRRSKIGFSTPVAEWFRGPWREFMLDTVHSSSFAECDLIEPDAVRTKIETAVHHDVPVHQADRAWAAIMPYFWEQGFFARAAARPWS